MGVYGPMWRGMRMTQRYATIRRKCMLPVCTVTLLLSTHVTWNR